MMLGNRAWKAARSGSLTMTMIQRAFSNLRNRLADIQRLNCQTLAEFYESLEECEKRLDAVELITYHKKVYQFSKRARRLLFLQSKAMGHTQNIGNENTDNENTSESSLNNNTQNTYNNNHNHNQNTQNTNDQSAQDAQDVYVSARDPQKDSQQFSAIYPILPMRPTYTSEFFYAFRNEITFGTKLLQIRPTLEMLTKLTDDMLVDLPCYYSQIVLFPYKYRGYWERIRERAIDLQQQLCGYVFNGYRLFSKKFNEVQFKKIKQYKGDYKYQLVNQIAVVEVVGKCIYNISLFNLLYPKLVLAAQMALLKYHNEISTEGLRRLMFAIAMNGSTVKVLQDKIPQFYARVSQYSFQLLFYMLVGGVQNYGIWLSMGLGCNFEGAKGEHAKIAGIIGKLLKEKHNIELPGLPFKSDPINVSGDNVGSTINNTHNNTNNKPTTTMTQAERDYELFLTKEQYTYSKCYNPITDDPIFQINDQKFLLLSSFYYNQDNRLNGAGLLMREYFLNRDEKIKLINWRRVEGMEKRGEKFDYFLSKMKGIPKPVKIRKRYYE